MDTNPFTQSTHASPSSGRLLVAQPTAVRVIAWGIMAFFIILAFMAYRDGQGEASPLFLFFVVIGVLILILAGPVTMNNEIIVYSNTLARYQMNWDEVKRVAMDPQKKHLVVYSANEEKVLSVMGMAYWSGADRDAMVQLFYDQLEKRRIPVEETQRAARVFSKNTKVR